LSNASVNHLLNENADCNNPLVHSIGDVLASGTRSYFCIAYPLATTPSLQNRGVYIRVGFQIDKLNFAVAF
jgi:hypothetical protein